MWRIYSNPDPHGTIIVVFWLIDFLRFYVPLKYFSLMWRRHHCRWRASKFRPTLGAQGLWAGSVPHLRWQGTSVFPVLSEGPPQSVASYDTQPDPQGEVFWWLSIWNLANCGLFLICRVPRKLVIDRRRCILRYFYFLYVGYHANWLLIGDDAY
jgi:hypothetical protein